MVPVALAQRARTLDDRWNAAREEAVGHLVRSGLEAYGEQARRRWDAALDRAFDEYRERWGTQHFVQRAQAAGLLTPAAR
ncbi:hypothetical protein GCM10020000_38240 [Streptomyces olivoverticillatus]